MGFDNEYDALRFDLGVAWKSYLIEKDEELTQMETLLNGFRNVVLSNGAKMDKIEKHRPLVRDYEKKEDFNVDVFLAEMLIEGKGVLVE